MVWGVLIHVPLARSLLVLIFPKVFKIPMALSLILNENKVVEVHMIVATPIDRKGGYMITVFPFLITSYGILIHATSEAGFSY